MRSTDPHLLKYKFQGVRGKETEMDGVYRIPHGSIKDYWYWCELKITDGWEHIAVSIYRITSRNKGTSSAVDRCLTWAEMIAIRNQFWGPQEVVMMFTPAMEDYIHGVAYKAHLWNPLSAIDVPQAILDRRRATQPTLDWLKATYPGETEQTLYDVAYLVDEPLGTPAFEKAVERLIGQPPKPKQ